MAEQYGPPENDRWWDKGFTEWTNVTKAEPLFPGHYQPHYPTELGYYDLRVRETMHEQIALAKEYGIDGFCYHYYWFSGKRLLDRPVDEMLADPDSDMPFCLCWANENWTRRWDAAEHEILIAQQYLPDDNLNFIKSIEPFFRDDRYIRVDGAPLLIVYRPQHLPDPQESADVWRRYCQEVGIGPIHICAALTHGNEDYQKFGFDSGVEFPPHNMRSRNINDQVNFHAPFSGNVMDFKRIASSYLERDYAGGRVFKSVFPSWDNTARIKDRALVIVNDSPENYQWWLARTIEKSMASDGRQQLVFINAWNEWAEGCHLEPDRRHGRAYLEATLNARTLGSTLDEPITYLSPNEAHQHNSKRRTLLGDLKEVFQYHVATRGISRLRIVINRFPRLKSLIIFTVQKSKGLARAGKRLVGGPS